MAALTAAAAAAGPILGGIAGSIASQGQREAANRAYGQASQILAGVQDPTEEELKVIFGHLQSQGELTPELEQALMQQVSEMKGITSDQGLKDVQRSALEQLTQTGRTGLNATDKAALQQITNQVAQQQQAQQQSILQNMAQRGMAGGGQELALKLASAQQGAQLAQQQGMDIAGQAQARALQAIAQSGALAGQQQGQDFDQKSSVAKAQDVINQFNTANSSATQARNISSKNSAAASNLGERQRIADANVTADDNTKLSTRQAILDAYNAKVAKAKGLSALAVGQANRDDAGAERTAQMYTKLGSGLGNAVGAAGGGGGGLPGMGGK